MKKKYSLYKNQHNLRLHKNRDVNFETDTS